MRSIMDSISDLSLLEIAGEDDTLLSDASTATDIFSCSPLISLRSRPPKTGERECGAVNSEDVNSSPKDSANKENTNRSKPEAQLTVEPHQMKRKKKVGGYNLRKSLAWDRAFFTEQGVLNPVELSMISGTTTPKGKSSLEVIHEEEPVTTSLALQEIEENLFKHSSGGVPIGDRKIGAGAGLSPKPGSLTKQTPPPASVAKRKVFGAGLSPKSGSLTKRTPPPASVAKRKVFAVNDVGNRPKRSACPRPVPSSSLRTDTVKAPSKESKVSRISGPKSDVSANTTTARIGMLNTGSSKRNQNALPSTNVQKYAGVKGPSQISKTVPSVPKVELADKCSVARTLTKQGGQHLDKSVSETRPPSRMHQPGSEANKVSEVCHSKSVSDTGEKKQQTLFQTKKLSGLRMPSPSLGFFSQAKASSSHGQLQKSFIPCHPSESNIPKLSKLGKKSVKEARSKIVKGEANNLKKEASLSDVNSEPNMLTDNKQMAGVEVKCDSLGFENISKEAKVENILQHVNFKPKESGELYENENVSSMENMVFPRHEKKLLMKSHTHEQLEKEVDHPPDEKSYDVLSNEDQSSFREPHSMHYRSMQRTSNNISNTLHNAMGQDEDDQIKLPTSDVLTFKESLVLQAEHETSFKDSRHSGEFMECHSVKTALSNSSLNDFSQTILGGSIQEIPCKSTEQVNGGVGDFDRCGRDAQVHLLDGTTRSNLQAINQQLQGEQLKTPYSSIVGEISSKEENESNVNSCQLDHVTSLFSKGSPDQSILEIGGASESESRLPEIKDCQLPVYGQSGFIPRKPVDDEYDQIIDSKAVHDRTQAFELDRLSEDYLTVPATASCTQVTNASPERRASENNIKNLHITSQLCPTVDADCDLGGNDMPVNNSNAVSELQPSKDTSMQCDVQRDVLGNVEQQVSMFTDPETSETHREDEISLPNHGYLLHKRDCCEVSADLTSNTKDSIGSGAENPFENNIKNLRLASQLCPTVNANCDFGANDMPTNNSNTFSELQPSKDTSIQCDVQHDVLGNFEQQASMFTYPEISEIPCEDEILLPGHGYLLHKSDCCEVSADLTSNTTDSIGSVAENPSGLLQHTLLPQSVQEFDHTSRETQESHEEDVQAQSFNENLVAHDCGNKHGVAVTNDQFSLKDDNNINDISHLSELQKPSDVVTIDSLNVNTILHLDGDCLPTNIASREEICEKKLVDGAFEGFSIDTSEHSASHHHIQAMPDNKDENHDVDVRAELLQIDDEEKGSSDILPSVEALVNEATSAEFGSSIKVSEDPLTEVVTWKSEEQCSLRENTKLLALDNPTFNVTIPEGSEVSSLNRRRFSDEAETTIFEKDKIPNTDMRCQTEGDINSAEDSSKIIHLGSENSATNIRQEVPMLKPPPNAAPFSDEWLAAIEAAGEEILTMKGGAVQNSPPDKSQQEPGPWSPVKKNQEIGPFDCTKHNLQHSGS